MGEQACGNCQFFLRSLLSVDKPGDDGVEGFCRRYPPQMVQPGGVEDPDCGDVSAIYMWESPMVTDGNWCGEWKPKKP